MGYVTIQGRSRATAEALLAAAKKVGATVHDVRTSTRGYIVPEEVAKEYEAMLAGETEPIEEPEVAEPDQAEAGYPDETWKNADIADYAEANGIDLGGATKKADMLAAIQSADTKEE